MNRNFKLELKQNNDTIYVSEFLATDYSPKTLSSIDVRKVLHEIFKELNNVSSSNSFDTKYMNYDFLKYYKRVCKLNNIQEYLLMSPEQKVLQIKDKQIKGVELTIIFYIDNDIIFDRNVYVYKYNPKFRFSMEMSDFMDYVKNKLLSEIKKSDVKNQYNEYNGYMNV